MKMKFVTRPGKSAFNRSKASTPSWLPWWVMRLRVVLTMLGSLVGAAARLSAQDLAPRAYVTTPVHSNAITITWAFYDGGVNFNGTVPISTMYRSSATTR
jgi:hypothetical protein